MEFRWTAGARVLLPLEELLEVWLETYKGARASRTASKWPVEVPNEGMDVLDLPAEPQWAR